MKTKYRGAQCAPMPSQADIQALCNAGANIIRYQMIVFEKSSGEDWKNGIRKYLDHFDTEITPILTEQRIILDIHWPPGPDMTSVFGNSSLMTTLLEMWDEISKRYLNNTKVYAYDILNEPAGNTAQCAQLMDRASAVIRANDSHKMIMVEPQGALPANFSHLQKSRFQNIYYESHMYKPSALTFQGIAGQPIGVRYPSAGLTKASLVRWLQPIRDFQLKTQGVIYIGEFAASVYTDSNSRINYYRDLIDIFEGYNWQWSIHAFRESPVWDMEVEPFWDFVKNEWCKNGG